MIYDRSNRLTDVGEAFIAWHQQHRSKRSVQSDILEAYKAGWQARTDLINRITGEDLADDVRLPAEAR